MNGSRTCRSVGLSYAPQQPPPPRHASRLSFISQAQDQAHPCRMAAGSSPTLGGFQGCVCPSAGQGLCGPGISRGCLEGSPTEALLQRWPAWRGLWVSPGKGCRRVKQGRAISPMFTAPWILYTLLKRIFHDRKNIFLKTSWQNDRNKNILI